MCGPRIGSPPQQSQLEDIPFRDLAPRPRRPGNSKSQNSKGSAGVTRISRPAPLTADDLRNLPQHSRPHQTCRLSMRNISGASRLPVQPIWPELTPWNSLTERPSLPPQLPTPTPAFLSQDQDYWRVEESVYRPSESTTRGLQGRRLLTADTYQKCHDPSPNYQEPRPTILRSTKRRAQAGKTTSPPSKSCNSKGSRYQSPTDPSVFLPNYSRPLLSPLGHLHERTGTIVKGNATCTAERSVQITEAPWNDIQGEAASICHWNPCDESLTPSPLKIRRKPVGSGDSRRNKHFKLSAGASSSSDPKDAKGKKPGHDTYQRSTAEEETSTRQGHRSGSSRGGSSNPPALQSWNTLLDFPGSGSTGHEPVSPVSTLDSDDLPIEELRNAGVSRSQSMLDHSSRVHSNK